MPSFILSMTRDSQLTHFHCVKVLCNLALWFLVFNLSTRVRFWDRSLISWLCFHKTWRSLIYINILNDHSRRLFFLFTLGDQLLLLNFYRFFLFLFGSCLNCLLLLPLKTAQLYFARKNAKHNLKHSANVDRDVKDDDVNKYIAHDENCFVISIEVCKTDLTVDGQHHKCLVQQQHTLVTFSLHRFKTTNQNNHDSYLNYAAEDC